MRIEDAIKTLKELWRETNDSWYEEVYKMAINALEANRETEPQIEDCGVCEHVRITCRFMERGEPCHFKPMDELQAIEVVEKCDRPLMDCENCWRELHCRVKDRSQMERSE